MKRTTRTSSRAAGTVLAAGLAFGVLSGLTAAPASAAPGDSAIADARAQADALTERIEILAGRLDRAQAKAEDAHARSLIALDSFQATQAELEAAEQRADVAEAAAEKALADLGVARGQVADFARQSYMDGSTAPGAAALLTSAGPSQMIERAALLEAAGDHRSDVLVQVAVLQQRAAAADVRAKVAVEDATTLERQAATALARATAAEKSARQQAAAVAARRVALADELQDAQVTLATLVGRQEAEMRARALREAAAPEPEPVVAPPSGNGGGNGQQEAPEQPSSNPSPGSSSAAQAAIAAAKQHLGLSYAWGGGGSNGPGWGWGIDQGVWGFDCSGLTQYAYAQAGIDIPRNSRAQYAALPKVSSSNLRAGDLVFWATSASNPATIYHVAIYLGGGQILESPQSGDVVKISPMRWYQYMGAARPSA